MTYRRKSKVDIRLTRAHGGTWVHDGQQTWTHVETGRTVRPKTYCVDPLTAKQVTTYHFTDTGADALRSVANKSNKRGVDSEVRFMRVARTLEGVTQVRPATSQEERCGIDAVITHYGVDFPFQIKSSLDGVANHRKRYPHVPAVVGAGEDAEVAAAIQQHLVQPTTLRLRDLPDDLPMPRVTSDMARSLASSVDVRMLHQATASDVSKLAAFLRHVAEVIDQQTEIAWESQFEDGEA